MSEPLYDRIGGAPTIAALVDRFYDNMEIWSQARHLRSLHREDLTDTRQVLKDYLTEWLGGPALFSQVKGHPRMKMRHMHVPIGTAERDAWMECMSEALEATISDAPSRQQIHTSMANLADWMRNKPE